MSNRTLVELNHDFCPGRATTALAEWGAKMATYMGSGDPADLPYGVMFKHIRHHSDTEPIEALRTKITALEQALATCDGALARIEMRTMDDHPPFRVAPVEAFLPVIRKARRAAKAALDE